MDYNFSETGSLLFENLGTAAYHVSKKLTEKMGYSISEERAALLIARSLIRKYTIDALCTTCEFIEDQDNEEYANIVHKVLNPEGFDYEEN